MLHPAYRLAIEPSNALTAKALDFKRWQRTLVVPRALCVFESLPCAGLAWHEHRQFARTQAARLAPFQHYGCNAAVAGNRLMLWFWDQEEVDVAMRHADLDPAAYTLLVEPLLRKPVVKDGADPMRSWGGIDHRAMANGAVLRTLWEQTGTAEETVEAPLLTYPWARELLSRTRKTLPVLERLNSLRQQGILLTLCSVVAVAATASYAAFSAGIYLGAEKRLTVLEQQADQADRTLGNLASLKQASATNERWVSDYRHLATSVQLDRLFAVLATVVEQNGVVIREFELRKDEVRLAVSSAGGEIDLPRLLEGLSRIPGVTDVQLRDNVELAQAGFSFRVPGFVALLTPPVDQP